MKASLSMTMEASISSSSFPLWLFSSLFSNFVGMGENGVEAELEVGRTEVLRPVGIMERRCESGTTCLRRSQRPTRGSAGSRDASGAGHPTNPPG
jgi:hypothetical protein